MSPRTNGSTWRHSKEATRERDIAEKLPAKCRLRKSPRRNAKHATGSAFIKPPRSGASVVEARRIRSGQLMIIDEARHLAVENFALVLLDVDLSLDEVGLQIDLIFLA